MGFFGDVLSIAKDVTEVVTAIPKAIVKEVAKVTKDCADAIKEDW